MKTEILDNIKRQTNDLLNVYMVLEKPFKTAQGTAIIALLTSISQDERGDDKKEEFIAECYEAIMMLKSFHKDCANIKYVAEQFDMIYTRNYILQEEYEETQQLTFEELAH